jgi:hypothetical protein
VLNIRNIVKESTETDINKEVGLQADAKACVYVSSPEYRAKS